ncbi:MAG TPA: signal recognition particle protein [Bacillota bacterium]|nr:signal recognition particle protein [Bacillota bacterium]HOH10291.1 signal recognition particle protein [Bacillota bacterium]HOY88932.1 signal recognition particle protein [Bacillota bacterium]HPI01702.1 signal recognition particle protein [Bacillota bacterium]HPM63894.1 signal recognition particle protein [Bacillota bacterium]
MAFEGLSEKLQSIMQKLKGHGKLSEKEIDSALKEVRIALLEADVNFKVVKSFIEKVRERALGSEVMQSLTPAQQVIKIVHSELIELMGSTASRLELGQEPPIVIMMVGLQGSGKTTTSAKLANLLKKANNKRPMLVACDTRRPAAVKQLETLGTQIGVPVHHVEGASPEQIAKSAVEGALKSGRDLVILDTAGRLHIDEELMQELERIKILTDPDEILLVVDAMTGQDAVNVAKAFQERLDITGVILTKLDGDARGGAALSVRAVTGKPIKFAGTGEKLDGIEVFHPDRMASRILGMGDILTVIEKAQESFDVEQAKKIEAKLRKQEFSLEDFLVQLKEIKKMGPLGDMLSMIPGLSSNRKLKDLKVDEKQMSRVEAIIYSMTPGERRRPDTIDSSRKKRIAAGSGTKVQDVNALLKQYEETKKLLKAFGGGKRQKMRMPGIF